MITKIKAEGFRGKSVTLSFHEGINKIKGRNESGKSGIKEALAFVWSGTDAAGTKSPDHLITLGEGLMEVSIGTEKSVVCRKKKRGETSTIRLIREGIPDIRPNQTEFQAMLGYKPDTFTSLWLSGYFMQLSTPKKLEVLGDLVKLDRRQIMQDLLGELPMPSKLKLVNPKVEADQLATERRALQNVVSSEEGQLTALQGELSNLQEGDTVDEAGLQERANQITAKLSEFDLYHRAAASYNEKQRTYEQHKSQYEKASEDIAKAEAEIASVTPEMNKLSADMALVAEQGNSLVTKTNEARATVKPRPTFTLVRPDHTAVGNTCSTCNQPISKEHFDAQFDVYNKALTEFNKVDREVADYNKGVLDSVAALERQVAAHKEQYVVYKQEHLARSNLVVTCNNTIAARQATLTRTPTAPAAPAKPEGDEQTLRAEVIDVSASLKTYRHTKARRTALETQISNITDACNRKRVQVLDLSKIESCLRQLPEVEVGMIVSSLQAEGVEVGMLDGELWFADDVGVRYSSLSSGRQMKADLAMLEKLRQLAGNKAPSWVYVDNADLVDDVTPWLPTNVQVIVAEVADTELVVE